ncbi:MAG: DUF4349 domain-containing protein [Clostridiaceae bacterium]
MKRLIGISIAILLMLSIFAGCGSSKSAESTASDFGGASVAPAQNPAGKITAEFSEAQSAGSEGDYRSGVENGAAQGNTGSTEAPKETDALAFADSLAGTGSTLDSVNNAILAERKIIRSANLTIEVENFDEACNNINSIILGIGIVQQSNINTDRVYVDNQLKLVKNGTIVLRVDKDKFDTVINNLMGIGDVYNQAINGQDVTDRFVDTESRLRLLKLEQSRLEAYLVKLEDLDKIFKTESRLTEIRQEIESLTGNLNKMSSLVELSTITITLNEKYPGAEKMTKPMTYWQRLLNKLKSSLEGVVEFTGDLLIFVISAIPVLILLGLFLMLGIFIYRKIPRKSRNAVTAAKSSSVEEKKEEQGPQ